MLYNKSSKSRKITEKGMLLDYSSRRRRQRRNIFIVLKEEIYYITLLKNNVDSFQTYESLKLSIESASKHPGS